jgi:acyl-coenzyme A thioesterase PaaI-like protein
VSASDPSALFTLERTGPGRARLTPSDYCRGPWDHGTLHGGPVGGIAGWGTEHLIEPRSDLLCTRLTVDLLSAVPLAPLDVEATLIKGGRRSQVVDVSITADDRIVARASSQWVRPGPGSPVGDGPPPPRPDQIADPGASDFDYPRPGFNCDASELRFVEGSTEDPGPATIWVRLTSPLIAGEATSPFVRAATVADLTAAAGWDRSPSGTSYINPDLTLELTRYPVGPWVAIVASNRRAGHGAGYNHGVLYDDDGSFGLVIQSLVETDVALS